MRFSDVAQGFDQPTNRLYARRAALEKAGEPIDDLLSASSGKKAYHPDPLGQRPAREAVSRYYKGTGLLLPADQIVLTPGTSLSYWYVFKLLANAGDEILCPKPSYPLFDAIASLAGVRLTSYSLVERSRWAIDFASLEAAITPRTRAIVLISPHNPTGSVATAEEMKTLSQIAIQHDLPIIMDEVFSAFIYPKNDLNAPVGTVPTGTLYSLVFRLNGFSKMLGLPGHKVGWIGVSGEAKNVSVAMKALEMISDTFLPMNEAAQAAVPRLLATGKKRTRPILASAARARQLCQKEISTIPGLSWHVPEGGFFGVLRFKDQQEEEEVALQLLEEGILVHPGYFYDIEGPALVFNFHQKPAVLKRFFRSLRLLKRLPQP